MCDDILDKLGPLAALAGEWQGDQGIDISPSQSGSVETKYREHINFTPLGPVNNGPQTLYGLRYAMTAWPLGSDEAFHEEQGYWLWDAKAGQVMRCFMVPRGVNILAGGLATADAKSFAMAADVGSETFGILSNPFLDQAFKTLRYTLNVNMHQDGSFSYDEDTLLQLPHDVFHHTDTNHLTRVKSL
ncbi:MAG: heme-binding beta-barrel domain-containing protein [Mariprofundaceae bacterium]